MLSYDEKSCLWYRLNSYDRQIISEIKTYHSLPVKNKIVMDIGGCFGAFAKWAVLNEAARVIVYEPDPYNYRLLHKNLKTHKNVTLISSALVNNPDQKEAFLYKVPNTTNNGSHSLTPFRGRNSMVVSTLCFADELKKYQPYSIKMDCEGHEYALLKNSLPDYVFAIAIEIHLNKKEWRDKGSKLATKIGHQFSNISRAPVFTGKNWHTTGVWRK